MSKTSYKITAADLDQLNLTDGIKPEDKDLINSYQLNSAFIPTKHEVNLTVYSSDGSPLEYYEDYRLYTNDSSLGNADEESLSSLEVTPSKDIEILGYQTGDVYIQYDFVNRLLVDGKIGGDLYIESISSDRTELRALLRIDDVKDLQEEVNKVALDMKSKAYYDGPYLKLPYENTFLNIVNIKAEPYKGRTAVFVKLYQPLPQDIALKQTFNLYERVIDTAVFSVEIETEPEEIPVPVLRGPNFNVEVSDENNNPTEFLNYNELFSYPVTSSYYELYSLFNEKSAQVSVDHTDYSTFIHFSSAEERLRNFKYKLDLITSYNNSITDINNTGYTLTGASGSVSYFEGLIEGIVNNFDHYERFLYFESGSKSWPKTTNTRPYEIDANNTSWFNSQIISASNYDNNNLDILTNTIPEFIREDSQNEPMIMFMHMLGQHFDNLWLYHKAVADKYDADNRLNYGISKDLVRTALESFGVKLYNSNLNLGQLFSMFTGEAYISGSEQINTYLVASEGTDASYQQPMPLDNYQKEVYKRIYHNLPLLTKGKGTERGLRALINCFGIPSEMLQIRVFGGQDSDAPPFYGPFYSTTSSLDKVRLDATGSIVSGSTLSNLTSIVKPDDRYSTDIHTIEIGVSHTNNINEYIQQNISSTFDIDEYIGDPREAYNTRYAELDDLAEDILSNLDKYDVRDFVRLIKFFDNSIFRIVRDFIPARSNLNSGIIVKPHILDRSKAKQVSASWTQPEYSASLEVGEYSGSHGNTFGGQDQYITSYIETLLNLSGSTEYSYHNHEEAKYDGEFSGSFITVSTGELNDENENKKPNTKLIYYNLYTINSSANFCNISFNASTIVDTTVTPTPTVTPSVTPTPTTTITPATCYKILGCSDGLYYAASKTEACVNGSSTSLSTNQFSYGDVVQFAIGTGCPTGATYCGTIVDVNFSALPDSIITRQTTVGGCGDLLHCQQ